MNKISRKEFIKKSGIISAVTLFSFSKLGKIKSVDAAVLDNSNSKDISNAVIYTDEPYNGTQAFRSGSKANMLAIAVNYINEKLHVKIQELTESFNEALISLKNTSVGRAVNITADNFPDATKILGDIKVYSNGGNEEYAEDGNITITSVDDVNIPEGFYSAGAGLNDSNNPVITIDRERLLSTDNLRDAGVRTITDNGIYSTLKDEASVYESIEVNIDENSEGVGKSVYNKGYDKATSDIYDAAISKTVVATTEMQEVLPDGNDLLKSVFIEPQKHTKEKDVVNISSNGATTIDLGEVHDIRKVPVNVNVQSSVSLQQRAFPYGGTASFYVGKRCRAILVISRATRYDLSRISITGCVLSSNQIGPSQAAVIGNEVRMHTDTFLLELNPGTLYVNFVRNNNGQEVNAAVLTII